MLIISFKHSFIVLIHYLAAITRLSRPRQNTLSTWDDIITVYFNDISVSFWLGGVQPIQRMAALPRSQSQPISCQSLRCLLLLRWRAAFQSEHTLGFTARISQLFKKTRVDFTDLRQRELLHTVGSCDLCVCKYFIIKSVCLCQMLVKTKKCFT